MRVLEKTVYTYDELSDSAKETARNWFRKDYPHYEWWDFVYDDFVRICEIMGIEIATRESRSVTGKELVRYKIWFSGFWSQGDGASFEGSYTYKKGSCTAIREYAPKDEELHRIADTLRDIQKEIFYDGYVSIKAGAGYHCSQHSMYCEVEPYAEVAWGQLSASYFPSDFQVKIQDKFTDVMRDLAHWLYRTLEREYEYLISDEQISESIRINEYEFDEFGSWAA